MSDIIREALLRHGETAALAALEVHDGHVLKAFDAITNALTAAKVALEVLERRPGDDWTAWGAGDVCEEPELRKRISELRNAYEGHAEFRLVRRTTVTTITDEVLP